MVLGSLFSDKAIFSFSFACVGFVPAMILIDRWAGPSNSAISAMWMLIVFDI